MMLVGVGVALALLALIAIAAICCYACGKIRTQRDMKKHEQSSNSNYRRQSTYQRISRLIPWRYPRMQTEEHPIRQVSQDDKILLTALTKTETLTSPINNAPTIMYGHMT